MTDSGAHEPKHRSTSAASRAKTRLCKQNTRNNNKIQCRALFQYEAHKALPNLQQLVLLLVP